MTDFPKKLGAALLKAQGEMRGIAKDGTNPHYKSKYATLENVTDTIRPVLQKHGVLFMQAPGSVNEHGIMALETIFVHAESGESFGSVIGVPLGKKDPQGVGSAITYACRYSLMALLGLPPVDDDGESAKRPPEQDLAKPRFIGDCERVILAFDDEKSLRAWWESPQQKQMRRDFELTSSDISGLLELAKERIRVIHAKELK